MNTLKHAWAYREPCRPRPSPLRRRWTWLLFVIDVIMSVAHYFDLVGQIEHDEDDPFGDPTTACA